MAHISTDPRNGVWQVRFRYGGKAFTKSIQSKHESAALRVKAAIEETLALLARGALQIPPEADPGTWIFTGGKLIEKVKLPNAELSRLGEIADAYLVDQHAKAASTIRGEQIHIGQLKRLLGESTKLASIDLAKLQAFVTARKKEKFREKKIKGDTIGRPLLTFSQIWAWARKRGYVRAGCPLLDTEGKWAVSLPLDKDRPPFIPLAEYHRRVERGGLTEAEKAELREVIFLNREQVESLMGHVEQAARHKFILPMYAMAAYAGMRRSEICRSQIEDFDFANKLVKIRECKRKKDKAESLRIVPMTPRLLQIVRNWLESHNGNHFTLGEEKTAHMITHHFKQTVGESEWSVVRGFHVLRHSFGAICLSAGIPRDMTGKWMGHSSEEMKTLYQHLFPEDEQAMIMRLA